MSEKNVYGTVWRFRAIWLIVAMGGCSLVDCANADESDEGGIGRVDAVHQPLNSINTDAINRDLKVAVPTVDIAIYLGETEGKPHSLVAKADDLADSFKRAKAIFAKAGVQLKLRSVTRAIVPSDWLSVQANEIRGLPSPPELNSYVGYRSLKWGLTKKSARVFEGIVERQDDNHRIIYLVYLKNVKMAYPDPKVTDKLKVKILSAGGLSLPAYLLESRIPRRIRGVITLTRNSGKHGRLIAHELGHKLINVSHEYREISPQFAVKGDGGLMLYGPGTEIPSGKAGRWHRERLHLSPFVYRVKKGGAREWNSDYREGGHYYDPLYGDKVIRFGKMEISKRPRKDAR